MFQNEAETENETERAKGYSIPRSAFMEDILKISFMYAFTRNDCIPIFFVTIFSNS